MSRIASLDNGAPKDGTKDAGGKDMTRNLAAVDPATFSADSTQLTEDQIGLDKGQRRDVQRRLTGLGFDTKVTGAFNDDTRIVIKRWQAARGYPSTGYLNKLQHKALLTEIVSATQTADDSGAAPRRSSSGGGGGGPSLSGRRWWWRRRWRCQPRRVHGRHDRRHDGRNDAPLTDRFAEAIGIGGSLAAPPLPHHRTYGSVYGGSLDYAVAGLARERRPSALKKRLAWRW